MVFIRCLFCYFVCLSLTEILFTLDAISTTNNKPKINKNTQTITKYGCERPKQWSKIEKQISIQYKNQEGVVLTYSNGKDSEPWTQLNLTCLFNTRNLVLFNSSLIEPKIEVKNCKNSKKEATCCKVLSGQWKVFDGEKDIIETEPKNIQIDHILPFNYIRLNMKDCKLANKYYNFLDNLEPMLASENNKKKDELCSTDAECWKQRRICKEMSNYFKDDKLCEEIWNVETKIQKEKYDNEKQKYDINGNEISNNIE